MNSVEDAPRPPAAAYYEMQSVLPERYFLDSIVYEGVELTVTGHDRVPTYWRLPEPLADAVIPVLSSRPVKVKHKRFSDRGRKERY
jgi:hypothetical protein